MKKFIPSCSPYTHLPWSSHTSHKPHLREAEGGAGLAAHHLAETSLALDDAVGHAHLTAEGRQEQNDLQRIHVVRDHHQLSFLLLNLRTGGYTASVGAGRGVERCGNGGLLSVKKLVCFVPHGFVG